MRWLQRVQTAVSRRLRKRGVVLERLSQQEYAYLSSPFAPDTLVPTDAQQHLHYHAPKLTQVRQCYAALDWPVTQRSRWSDEKLAKNMDLVHFRGETPFMWHYRERLRVTRLKFLIYLHAIKAIDKHQLLDTLHEDGAFGCWTYQFEEQPLVSRDLLESIAEITFLEQHTGVLSGKVERVLDIGAGYGRLAHRLLSATPTLKHYCCIDAIAESSYLCDYYLEFRKMKPRAQVVALNQVEQLKQHQFDLAINIHSFSECPIQAVEWWMKRVGELNIPWLLIVPNQPKEMLSTEPDNSKQNFLPLIENQGYRLHHVEPTISDSSVRNELGIYDHFHLFRRE